MTIEEKMTERLEAHGLWPEEAQQVVAQAQESAMMERMKGRWGESTEAYPPQLLSVVWFSVKQIAIEHLEATKPEHFALALLRG